MFSVIGTSIVTLTWQKLPEKNPADDDLILGYYVVFQTSCFCTTKNPG
jgi:hypothetical protein